MYTSILQIINTIVQQLQGFGQSSRKADIRKLLCYLSITGDIPPISSVVSDRLVRSRLISFGFSIAVQ